MLRAKRLENQIIQNSLCEQENKFKGLKQDRQNHQKGHLYLREENFSFNNNNKHLSFIFVIILRSRTDHYFVKVQITHSLIKSAINSS